MFFPLLFVFCLFFTSCGDDVPTVKNRQFSGKVRPGASSIEARAKQKRKNKQKLQNAEGTGEEGAKLVLLPNLTDESFVEVPSSRDPFRSFQDVIAKKKLATDGNIKRKVILPQYDINSLRLMAIVTGVGNPRAMLIAPTGKGHIIRRGDYVGRGEIVERPDSEGGDIQINWRVARIRGEGKQEERGIFLIREDPTAPKNAQVTKFVALYPLEKR